MPGISGPYFSEYIVHFEAVDDSHTRVEIIGFNARERTGTQWSMSAPDGWFACLRGATSRRLSMPSATRW